jgi:alpha-1,3-rhamnosyl/mannosyltransferase
LIGDRGALPELAAGAALAIDPEDEAALAAGLERILGDTGLRRRLTAAARKRASEFSWQRSGAAMLELLEATAGKAPAPAVVTI